MSKKSRIRGPVDKQHGKHAEPLLKSAWQLIYQNHWSLLSQLKWKKALFFTCEILKLLANTLAAEEKYAVLNRDNLTIPIQMHLSQKQKTFSQYFGAFLASKLNLKYFEKKMTRTDFVFPQLRTLKTWSDKCLKTLVSEDPSRSNMVNVPNHYWNLHSSIFIKFIDQFQINWVGRSLCFSHPNSWHCLPTHWLPMKSILFLIETI